MREWLFTVGVTAASWAFRLRDWAAGTERRMRRPSGAERISVASEGRRLDAVWVAPPARGPVLLVCHGIGETVGLWGGVQAYLEERGVGSLVFDYAGYGRSEGWVSAGGCEADLRAAYAEVRRRVGAETRVYVLGFSLGSGVAAHGAAGLAPRAAGLILCEAFTSFRDAMGATGLPRWTCVLAPAVWDSVEAVRASGLRTLVVHSDGDRLFPVEMGRAIAAAGGAELLVVLGYGHDDLYRRPEDGYWGGVVEWMGR